MPKGVYKRSKKQLIKLKEISNYPRKIRNGGYQAIHKWLKKHFGKANKCENTFCENKSNIFQWAKKKGFEYEHKLENFIQLCCKCHIKYDYTKERAIKSARYKFGVKLTKKHRINISKSCKGINKGNKHSAKKIIQIDCNGNLVKIWDCINDAAIFLKISPSGITMCAKGKLKQSGGYKWNYLNKLQV